MGFTAGGLLNEAEWRKCKADPLYCYRTYWKIQHPERGATLPDPREAQTETLELWLTVKQSITLKARQIGFSTLAAFVMWHDTFFYADRPEYALSKTEREAQKLLRKVKYGYERLPSWMTERGPKPTQYTLQKIEWSNGSTIECLPATDPARGEAAYKIFVDEWAHFEDQERAWSAIEPATDIGGRVHALSSANGMGNLFHTMWVQATTGSSDFVPIFYDWSVVPERDQAWYENKKRNTPEWILHQEYPRNPEEAFIKSGNPVFDVDELNRIEPETPARGYLHELTRRAAEFRYVGDGPLRIWKQPLAGAKYVIGADVAEGLEHGDFSSAHVLELDTGMVVAKWKGHIDPDLFGSDVLWYLGLYYNTALIGVEANNHGYTTIVALRNKHYPALYYRTSYDERSNKQTRKLGWMTTAKTKPLMVDELVKAMRIYRDKSTGEVIDHPEILLYDSETIAELMQFVRDIDGKMHGSPFDDQTMSLAIANQMRKHRFLTQDQEEDSVPYFSVAWFEHEADLAEAVVDEWLIGKYSGRD